MTRYKTNKTKLLPSILILLLLLVTGCTQIGTPLLATSIPNLPPVSTPAVTAVPTSIPSQTPSEQPPTPTPEPTAIPEYEPAGCQKPPDDYARVEVNNVILNQRTLAMLQHAMDIYGGKIDLSNRAITQGSYSPGEAASFSTHDGGGAVDISVRVYSGGAILYHEIEPAIRALRAAGFAAWLRQTDELYEGSPIHIHAIAIGDRELSKAAQEQLTGQFGYFQGYSGIPQDDGIPDPDPHGEPVICKWMEDLGYSDLREMTTPVIPQWAQAGWQERLRKAGEGYLAETMDEAQKVAQKINYMEGDVETPGLMCGPLAAALWRDAGLLPVIPGPALDLHNYWLANPKADGSPWTFFSPMDYTLYHFTTPINKFDFFSFPLLPGDFLYTYAGNMGYDHMFVVTETDDTGRAFTVSNTPVEDHIYAIERLLLYEPNDPKAGVFQNEWVTRFVIGTTGLGGFDVLRPNGISLPRGDHYSYTVRPGDTLPRITSRFDSRVDAILELNNQINPTRLQVGESIVIPVNLSQPAPLAAIPVNLETRFQEILKLAPEGDWSVCYKNLRTGEIVSINENLVLHSASSIKLGIGMLFFAWLDQHPETTLEDAPSGGDQRTFNQLMEAMLVISEEYATDVIYHFLSRQTDFSIDDQLEEWGLVHTKLEPRRSTTAELTRLLEILYKGDGLKPESRLALLKWLRQPSQYDDLRLGGGLPVWVRTSLAHKPGVVFEDGWGVVADAGFLEWENTSYAISVISNHVAWKDYELAMSIIARFSQAAFLYSTK